MDTTDFPGSAGTQWRDCSPENFVRKKIRFGSAIKGSR
jgi:hypothetical protein